MPKKSSSLDFAGGFAELEEIVQWFERGEPDVARGLEKFKRAMALSQALKAQLQEAENQIKQIREEKK